MRDAGAPAGTAVTELVARDGSGVAPDFGVPGTLAVLALEDGTRRIGLYRIGGGAPTRLIPDSFQGLRGLSRSGDCAGRWIVGPTARGTRRSTRTSTTTGRASSGGSTTTSLDTRDVVGTTTVRVEVFVDDPDTFVARAVEAGAEGHDPVRNHQTLWGTHRQGGFFDPFGHLWLVGDRSPLSRFRG